MVDVLFLAGRLRYWILHPRFTANILARTYYYTHPEHPWLTWECNELLDKVVSSNWNCFEWGSGRSTIFFAKRAKSIVSIEHDRRWCDRVSGWASAAGLTNLDLRFVPFVHSSEIRSKEDMAYPESILEFPDSFFDCILIDGILRNECIRNTPRKLKPEGIAILDDSGRNYDESPFGEWPRRITADGAKSTTVWTKPRSGT